MEEVETPEGPKEVVLKCGCQSNVLVHTKLDLFEPLGVEVGMRITQCEKCKQILNFDLVVPPPPEKPQIHLTN
jgi:hypothetical protein